MARRSNDGLLRLSPQIQERIIAYGKKVLQTHKAFSSMQAKMEAIDKAYARYKARDESQANVPCDIFANDSVTPPVVISQVDSLVANWADVYLSGYPLFPVVSTNKTKQWAEQLEAMLDDHATLGGYARQLLLALRDGAKYNFCAIEADWDTLNQFSVLGDFTNEETGTRIDRSQRGYTRIERLDPYNTVFDYNVPPGDVSMQGDHAGYIKMLSKIKLKRLLNKYSLEQTAYNVDEAMAHDLQKAGVAYTMNYRQHPSINNYVDPRVPTDQFDWEAYMAGHGQNKQGIRPGQALNYEVFTLYARIIPREFGIAAPQPNTPQIWKFVIVNEEILIHAKRVISANDCLPILIGQPQEDGLGYQTQGVAEAAIDFQESAEKLFNIRFASARRAVSDRALYNADAIRPSDVNSKAAAPKIPVRTSSLAKGEMRLQDLYHAIPFDSRGTETVLQDATIITEFAKDLAGLNNAQRGQFQKGNKSVQEWEDVMARADGRTRLPIISLEFQIFVPLKQILLINLWQYGEDSVVVSQKTGEVLEVDIAELRRHVLAFRLADGHTPKAKLASTETLMAGMNMIMNSPVLQQSYGAQLPAIFAHLMQLGGVRGLEEYASQDAQLAPLQGQPGGAIEAPQGQAPIPGQVPQDPMALLGAMQGGVPGQAPMPMPNPESPV